jgi:hypothetical protein
VALRFSLKPLGSGDIETAICIFEALILCLKATNQVVALLNVAFKLFDTALVIVDPSIACIY